MAVLLTNRVLLVGCLSILHYVTQVGVVVAMENRPDKYDSSSSRDTRWSSALRDNSIDPFLWTPSEFQHISPNHGKKRQWAESSAALEYDIGENGVTAITQARPRVSSTSSNTYLQESDTSNKIPPLDYSEYIDFPEDIVDSDMAANSRRSKSNRINNLKFSAELENYLAEYYPVVEVEEVLTRTIPRNNNITALLGRYLQGEFPEIANLVDKFLKGPLLSDLGEQFPPLILNSWIQQEFMPDLSRACYRQLESQQIQRKLQGTDGLIARKASHLLRFDRIPQTIAGLRTLFTKNGNYRINKTIRDWVGGNNVVGIIFKHSAKDNFKVRIIWLPDHEKYTCESATHHLTRHYYVVRPFSFPVKNNVKDDLVKFMLRLNNTIESRSMDKINYKIYKLFESITER